MKHKRFTIIQNDRTKQTFLRLGDDFIEATEAEFEPIKTLAKALRGADDPQEFMEMVVEYWKQK